MRPPAKPKNESQRLAQLRALDLLDTSSEERFDRITRLAKRVFDVPVVLVSLVDAERQWFKSRQGIDVTETPREIAFCAHAVADDAVLVVPDARTDERFQDNPLVVNDPSIRFYAGCPVHSETGLAVGTICLIDRKPRNLSTDDVALLRDLAALVEDEFRSNREATTDPLTGISNRRGFELLANKAIAVTQRMDGGTSTLLSFDLDSFKEINDRLGHAVGDRALVDFATALLETFRDADVIGRLGGDEFAVLACGRRVDLPLARLEAKLAVLPDRPYQVVFSVGAAEHVPNASLDETLAAADRAMYEAKARRKLRPT